MFIVLSLYLRSTLLLVIILRTHMIYLCRITIKYPIVHSDDKLSQHSRHLLLFRIESLGRNVFPVMSIVIETFYLTIIVTRPVVQTDGQLSQGKRRFTLWGVFNLIPSSLNKRNDLRWLASFDGHKLVCSTHCAYSGPFLQRTIIFTGSWLCGLEIKRLSININFF